MQALFGVRPSHGKVLRKVSVALAPGYSEARARTMSSWKVRFRASIPLQANLQIMGLEQDAHLDVSELPPPPLLLAPVPATPPLERPASWLSVSSGGSGDVFDSELFDAFPSVPGGIINRQSGMQYSSTAASANQQRGQGQGQPRRPHTMYGAPTPRQHQ